MGALAGGIYSNAFHGITGMTAIILMLFHATWATIVLARKNERMILGFHRAPPLPAGDGKPSACRPRACHRDPCRHHRGPRLSGFRPEYAVYARSASGPAVSRASVQRVWEQVRALGGKNRYYSMNALWTLRVLLDWSTGGPGRNRGRRHPTELRLGDGVDSWRVIAIDPPRSLTLLFGMKAPSAGVMELVVAPEADGNTRITVTAYWHPAGFRGLLYWYVMAPAHGFIFKGMTRAIATRAEQAEAETGNQPR